MHLRYQSENSHAECPHGRMRPARRMASSLCSSPLVDGGGPILLVQFSLLTLAPLANVLGSPDSSSDLRPLMQVHHRDHVTSHCDWPVGVDVRSFKCLLRSTAITGYCHNRLSHESILVVENKHFRSIRWTLVNESDANPAFSTTFMLCQRRNVSAVAGNLLFQSTPTDCQDVCQRLWLAISHWDTPGVTSCLQAWTTC